MDGIARIFGHADFRLWLGTEVPTTSALRLVYPQKRKFVSLGAMRKMPDYRSFRIGGGGLTGLFVRFAQYMFRDPCRIKIGRSRAVHNNLFVAMSALPLGADVPVGSAGLPLLTQAV